MLALLDFQDIKSRLLLPEVVFDTKALLVKHTYNFHHDTNMLELLAVFAAAGYATAQDMTAIVTPGSDTDLLAYTTITTACLPAVDPNSEPIFSIQTDTNVESCTYVVNADNTAQVS